MKYVVCSLLLAAAGIAHAAAGAEPDAKTRAEQVLKTAGLKGGVIAHLECGDGKLTAELGRGKRFIVHGLSTDEKEVATAREYIRSQKLYGRVSVERGSFERLPYAANLVNLVVAEDGPALLAKGLSVEEVFRVLAPRGMACFGSKGEDAAEGKLKGQMKKAGFEDAGVTGEKDGRLWRKPVPGDAWAGPPRTLQWLVTEYYGGGIADSAGGRIFHRTSAVWKNENGTMVVSWRAHWRPSLRRGTVGPYKVDFPLAMPEGEAAKKVTKATFVIARDAHNGRILWIRALKPGKKKLSGNLIRAEGELVYTLEEDKLVALNGATGELVRTYGQLPVMMPRVHKGMFLYSEGGWQNPSITAAGAGTGEVLWKAPIYGAQLGDGVVLGRKGKNGPLVCLDLKTGKERWSREDVKGTPRVCGNGMLVLVTGGGLQGVACKDGKPVWDTELRWMRDGSSHKGRKMVDGVPQPREKPYYENALIYLLEGRVWVRGFQEYANDRVLPVYEKQAFTAGSVHYHGYDPYYERYDPRIVRTMQWIGIDPLTGEEGARLEYPRDLPLRKFGCGGPEGKARFIHAEPRGVMDLRLGKWFPLPGARAACGTKPLLAEGLTFLAHGGCSCAPQIPYRGYMVVAPIEWEPARAGKVLEAGRLEKGPAFGKVTPDGGKLTFTVKEEQHLVEARSAGSKEGFWTFTASARIDTSPVVCQGTALVGSRDGYVYALRASDGALVWRFRAAPGERRMVAFDQLESAWPIVGGVLVADDIAYFLAGLHSEFAGGVTVYAVKPGDGTVVWKQLFDGTGGTSSRGGPTWGDVVISAKPLRDGTRLIIPGTRNLPGKKTEVRPIDGLGGKIMDLKTGKVEQPVGAKFSKVLNPTGTYTFDGQLKIWKGMKKNQ